MFSITNKAGASLRKHPRLIGFAFTVMCALASAPGALAYAGSGTVGP